MKLTHIHENIVDLAKHREMKKKENRPFSTQEVLDNLDDTFELTITYLVDQGMIEGDALNVVMKHLSDVVMGHDLGA